MAKKKFLAIITRFEDINSIKVTWKYFLDKLSNNFEKVYFISSEGLEFYPRYINHNLNDIKNKLPINFELFNPKNTKEFSNFLDDKDLIVINHFGKYFSSIKIHYLLKKFDIKQIQVTSVGQHNFSMFIENTNFVRKIIYKLRKKIIPKLVILLGNLGLIAKVDIRFISNKAILKKIFGSKFKKFLYEKKFFFAKELILVNSFASDIKQQKEIKIAEDYIVHLDASLNYNHETELRGYFDDRRIKDHYLNLEKFLKTLSNLFNKPVKVCIHPRYNLTEHKKFFPDFEVIQFKTRDYVYKAYIVTTFDSSAVIDAIMLKKKIIGITSDHMSLNETRHSLGWSNIVGYTNLNTKNIDFEKKFLLEQLENNLEKYENYIKDYLKFDESLSGAEKVINTIKERYFKI